MYTASQVFNQSDCLYNVSCVYIQVLVPYVTIIYKYVRIVVYIRTPKQQMAVFSQWLLEANQNISDTWLDHIE